MVVVVVAFFSFARILGKCSTIHFSRALFLVFVLKWRFEVKLAHTISTLCQDQSTMAQQAETIVNNITIYVNLCRIWLRNTF